MKDYLHTLEMSVRDYECDLQGIVNNAVYQNYLEHARHELLRNVKIDFVDLHESGVDPVLIKAEIEYKASLRSRDKFIVATNVVLDDKVRAIFEQDIYLLSNHKPVLMAVMTTLFLRHGRPVRLPEDFIRIFSGYPENYNFPEK
jgi:acyl-CoA thioester hydrolase